MFTNSSEKMNCLQLGEFFNFQICGTFLQVFLKIFFVRLRLTLYKCVISAFIQRSWRIRNWTIEDFDMRDDGRLKKDARL